MLLLITYVLSAIVFFAVWWGLTMLFARPPQCLVSVPACDASGNSDRGLYPSKCIIWWLNGYGLVMVLWYIMVQGFSHLTVFHEMQGWQQIDFALSFEHSMFYGITCMFVAYMTKTVPRVTCQGMARQRCDSPVGHYLLIKSQWEFWMNFVCVWNPFTEVFHSIFLKPFSETLVQQQEKYDNYFFLNFLQGSQNLSFDNTSCILNYWRAPIPLSVTNIISLVCPIPPPDCSETKCSCGVRGPDLGLAQLDIIWAIQALTFLLVTHENRCALNFFWSI